MTAPTQRTGYFCNGFGNNHTSLADDFNVTDNLHVTRVRLYAYSWAAGTFGDFTGFTPPTSVASLVIWRGGLGYKAGTLVFGAPGYPTPIVSTGSTYIGRAPATASAGPSILAVIYYLDFVLDLQLSAATYWLEWALGGGASDSDGPYTPPVSKPGETVVGNAMQHAQWDVEGPGALPAVPIQVALPFVISGTTCAP